MLRKEEEEIGEVPKMLPVIELLDRFLERHAESKLYEKIVLNDPFDLLLERHDDVVLDERIVLNDPLDFFRS